MIIDNFNNSSLTTLYVSKRRSLSLNYLLVLKALEAVTGAFSFIWANYINRYNIKPEVQADPAVDVGIDLTEQARDQVDVLRFDQLGDLKGPEGWFYFSLSLILNDFSLLLVISFPRVNMIRPYFLGCVVRNVDLATPGNLEKILNLQVNNFRFLHDCNR